MDSLIDDDLKLLKNSKNKLKDASNAHNNNHWTYYKSIQNKIKVYTQNTHNGCGCVCGIGVINAKPTDILKVITNSDNWNKIDPMLDSSEYINLTDTQRVVHLKFKNLYLISSRDVVFMETIYTKKDGTIMIVSSKTGLEDKIYPKSNTHVRTELISGGWHIVPVNEGSLVTYYNHTDFKFDNINSILMNMIVSKIPDIILKIEKLV